MQFELGESQEFTTLGNLKLNEPFLVHALY